MHFAKSLITSSLVALTFAVKCPGREDVSADATAVYDVRNTEDLAKVQALIRKPAQGEAFPIVVRLAPQVFVLEDSLLIGRSDVMLLGQSGTRLVLADHVNKPVVAVGSQAEYVTSADLIENIVISDIEIDGNKDGQDRETGVAQPWIRNNGIDVRAVRRLTIERVAAGNNRSGGLVISWGSSDVRVADCVFERNFFDGIAFYASTRILVTNCAMVNNGFAGISLDNDLLESEFSGCIVDSNGDVGVFARNSSGLTFRRCVIRNSGNWAVFLGPDEKDRGVSDVEFALCQLRNNRGGLFMAAAGEQIPESRARVIASTFHGNEKNGRRNIETSGSSIWTADNLELN